MVGGETENHISLATNTCFFLFTKISASTGAGIQVIFHLGFFVWLFRSVVLNPYGLYPKKVCYMCSLHLLAKVLQDLKTLEYTSFRVDHYSSTILSGQELAVTLS